MGTGVKITDAWEVEDEGVLTIAQDIGKKIVEEYPVQMIEDGTAEAPQQQMEYVPAIEMQDLHEILKDKPIRINEAEHLLLVPDIL